MNTAAIAALIAFTVLLVWAFESRQMPVFGMWHTVPLKSEFSAGDATARKTQRDYLDQKEQLFRELRVKIYRAGGLQDPKQLPRNWNRTFELVPEKIRGGALLTHGLN